MALVTWTENALDDLDAICLFIARSTPLAADLLAHRMFQATERLATFPRLGREIPDFPGGNLRELILGSYRIAYRITGDEVEILAIHHGARDRTSLDT